MFKKPGSAVEMEELVKERVVLSNVGRWVDAIEECNNRRFHDRRFLDRALLCFASADRNARLLEQTRVQSYSQYYQGNAALLKQNVKDAKAVLRDAIKKVCAYKKACQMSPRSSWDGPGIL